MSRIRANWRRLAVVGSIIAKCAAAIVVLTAYCIVTGWRHASSIAQICELYGDPDPASSYCTNATSLTSMDGWAYWIDAALIAGIIVLFALLAILGMIYALFGRLIRISGDDAVYHRRKDYVSLTLVVAGIAGGLLVFYAVTDVAAKIFGS